MKYAIFLLFMQSILYINVFAGEFELSREIGKGLSEKEISDLLTRGYRDRRVGEFNPPVTKTSRPADYINPVDRGTIEFSSEWKNYSFHKIKVPDGIGLRDMNFTQISPDTDAFDRTLGFGHNLEFVECNLANVRVYDDWTVNGCFTAQIDFVGTIDGDDFSVDSASSVYVSSASAIVDALRKKPIGTFK